MLQRMSAFCMNKPQWKRLMQLFLLTYEFLLRLPSEALPIVKGGQQGILGQHAVLWKDEACQQLVLTLSCRKNKQHACSRLVRSCTCRKSCATCAYHIVEPLWDSLAVGDALWAGITTRSVLQRGPSSLLVSSVATKRRSTWVENSAHGHWNS